MAEPLRTLIVDDEPAAIRRLVRQCAALPAVSVVATADDGTAALHLLRTIAVDLILLDIAMPGMSGLALAEQLAEQLAARPATQPSRSPIAPAIVFVTAFEHFAIQAFAVDAVGYLLKPVDPDLLAATVDRVARRAIVAPPPIAAAAGFWVPQRGTLVRLGETDIDHITGEDDYARLHCGDRSYLVAERLYAIEQRLGAHRFVRIHRSTLVNTDRIAALVTDAGTWSVRLSSGKRLAIGRSFLPTLRARLNVGSAR